MSTPAVAPAEPPPFRYDPPTGLPRILHLDADLVAVDKPSGLLSVPGRGPQHADSAHSRLQAELGPLWVVHRLDMDTSGVIVYARSREAAASLGRRFEERGARKRYVALVEGAPSPQDGTIDLPLRLDWPHRPRQIVDHEKGKPSLTRYRLIERAGEVSRLELHPLTGRSHQLRVHLAAIGHPIVGDRFYGIGPVSETRLMLHAQQLAIAHPQDGRLLEISAEPPF